MERLKGFLYHLKPAEHDFNWCVKKCVVNIVVSKSLRCLWEISIYIVFKKRTHGLMDKATGFEPVDCRFDSC